jgi:predicted DNA-binding transcriptional regulator YafY
LREDAGTVEPDRLCKRLGVSKRTLQRDLNVLRAAGEDIDYLRAERGYRTSVPAAAVAVGLCTKELAVVLIALDKVAREGDSELEETALAAQTKVRGVLEVVFPSIVGEVEKWTRELGPPADGARSCQDGGG